MQIFPKGRDGAQLDVISTPMEEGNAIKYTVSMVATNSIIGIPLRVADYCPSDIRIAIMVVTFGN